MGEVVKGEFPTDRFEMPLQTIVDGALKRDVSPCILIGREPDGTFYMAGTTADAGKVLTLLERARLLIADWID